MNRNTITLGAALLAAACAGSLAAYAEPSNRTDPFAAGAKSAGAANPFRVGAGPSAPPASPAAGSRRAESDRALLEARRALAVGDVARAQTHLAQAQELGVAYSGPGDSPQSVADSIHTCQELAAMRKNDGAGAGWRQAYAKFLATQADALVSWNDLDGGARAANEAAQLYPQFPPGGVTPQNVLIRIQKMRAAPVAGASPSAPTDAKSRALELVAQSRAALASGDLAAAQRLAGEARQIGVPDSQFNLQEDSPGRLTADLDRARGEADSVKLATGETELGLPATATPGGVDYQQAAGEFELPADAPLGAPLRLAQLPDVSAPADRALPGAAPDDAFGLLENGERALKAGDRAAALDSFRAAYRVRDQLDVIGQQRLQGHLQMLSAPEAAAGAARGEQLPAPDGELLQSADADRGVLARQMSADVGKRQIEAQKLLPTNPTGALELLAQTRTMVDESALDGDLKKQLVSRIDSSVRQSEKYVKDHKAELELDAANREVLDEINRERVVKVEVSQRMAEMVDQFNKLVDEQRFAEAEVVANRLYEMAPDELVAQQINKQAKMIRREKLSNDIRALSEDGVANMMLDAREAAARALADAHVDFGYGKTWDSVKNRKAVELGKERNIKEIEIEQKLRTQVLPRYDATPLTKVVEGLSQLAGVNIHLDPLGLTQEGVDPSTPVTLNLPQEISLKSALTLILEPLHLTYTIKDEVLKITSEQIRDGEVYVKTYPVGDLVIPIPNFVPNNNIGLQGLINDAYAAMGGAGVGAPGPLTMVAGSKPSGGVGLTPANAMAQQFGGGSQSFGAPQPPGASGPGGLGGAALADFDSLIDLIVNTVEHDTWLENGTGEGEIQPFPTNLSLVISQTQRVHEQVADLLEQLRRLQDLQVTIEVRFIRLTDAFFERIGVDFDFNIEDRSGPAPNGLLAVDGDGNLVPQPYEPPRNSITVGLEQRDPFPGYTVDLDLPFRQGSFGLTAPTIGGLDANSVGSFGFAILSDIEAYFLLNAGQGDQRANVLQAPKVTLFNGQQAVVIDSAFRPFVISVIPVVGEFAAAQQPVIVVLSEGTMMTVQAVVSDDRRYVRLTLVPFFSQIGDVRTFTFEGSETVSTSSSSTDDDEDGDEEQSDDETTTARSGTTVQLPTFEVISVATTVSVPDGGTVLLGGIKRLREQRNEAGVPLLSKIAYIDRLFRNVGIGRETDSLMMMVTPHIIIQEEEEERIGVSQE